MNIAKYAAKLGKMSAGEIRFRVKQLARNRTETLRWKIGGGNGNSPDLFIPRWLDHPDYSNHVFPDPNVRFFGLDGERKPLVNEYRSAFGKHLLSVYHAADALLNHQFKLLGLDFTLPDDICWNENPLTGVAYPLAHFSQMDTFNTQKYGDVKYVWELNRHQFFIEVGKAYYLSGEEKYAEKIVAWLESWYAQVPYKFGINHTSVLEHAVRIYSWAWAFYLTRESPVWTLERRTALQRQLMLQGELIEENLSYFYSPYNHLIGELAALAFLGTLFPVSARLQRWRDHYWAEMEGQLEKQFHTDGFTVEQASYYHHFTLGFYLQVALLRRRNGLAVSSETWDWLERALAFPMQLTRPDGQLPMLGDIDSARSLYFYRPDPKWNLRSFLALGAALFQRPDMKHVAGEPAEELFWLLGAGELADYHKLPETIPAQTSRWFPESGYGIMRDGWSDRSNYLLFDCGEIAHGVHRDATPSAAHGHGDILSIELCLAGQPLFVDPGFHTYFGDIEWHRYFRDSRGHNTVTVNGAGQAIHEGRIGWSQASTPRLRQWLSTPALDYACGEIDRFAGIDDSPIHRRHVLFLKSAGFLIFDTVAGTGLANMNIESSFHLHPGEAVIEGNALRYNGHLVAYLALPQETGLTLERGGDGPAQGWNAPGYGEMISAPVLRIAVQQALPFCAGICVPLPGNTVGKPDFQRIKSLSTIPVFEWRQGPIARRIYLNGNAETFSLPGKAALETDALCVVETLRDASIQEWLLLGVGHLHSQPLDLSLKLNGPDADGVRILPTGARTAAVEMLTKKQ